MKVYFGIGDRLSDALVPARMVSAEWKCDRHDVQHRQPGTRQAPCVHRDGSGLSFVLAVGAAMEGQHAKWHVAWHVTSRDGPGPGVPLQAVDAIFRRVQEAGLTYGSKPWSADDRKLNDWGGGRGVYFRTPDGHLLELMTVPQ